VKGGKRKGTLGWKKKGLNRGREKSRLQNPALLEAKKGKVAEYVKPKRGKR